MNSKLWTIDEVAEFLGIPKNTLYQWRTKSYGPPGIRMGRHLRFRREDVESWVLTQRIDDA